MTEDVTSIVYLFIFIKLIILYLFTFINLFIYKNL